jgi:putative ABC transport system permease protein
MKSYLSLIARYLKVQKKRSFLTVTGIVLSVALMVFSFIFIENIKLVILESSKKHSGGYHLEIHHVTPDQFVVLQNHNKVNKVGWVTTGRLSLPKQKIRLQVTGIDQGMADLYQTVTIKTGVLPAKDNEVALEEWVLPELGLQGKIGESVTLGSDSFQLSGIIQTQRGAQKSRNSLALVSPAAAQRILDKEDQRNIAYVQFLPSLVHGSGDMDRLRFEIQKSLQIKRSQVIMNSILAKAIDEYNNNQLPSILIISINALAMIITIYNIFHISVLEKIKQYGILSSIGTTPRQLRNIVLGEAFVYSIFSIPVGLLLGLLISLLVFHLSPLMQNVSHFSYPAESFYIPVFITLVTVFIAAWRPARIAATVSPLEAMRLGNGGLDKKLKTQRKSGTIIQSVFGITGQMAYQNLLRNKARFFVTILSLSIGIILFLLNSFYIKNLDPAVLIRENYLFQSDYYVFKNANRPDAGFTTKDVQVIEDIPGVTEVYRTAYNFGYTPLDKTNVTSTYAAYLEQTQTELNSPYAVKDKFTSLVKFYGYSPDILERAKSFVIDGNIHLDKLASGEEILLIDKKGDRKTTFHAGDEIELGLYTLIDSANNAEREFQQGTRKIKIGAILDEFPAYGSYNGLKMIVHEDLYNKLSPVSLYNKLDVKISPTADKETVEKQLKQLANEADAKYSSFAEDKQGIESDIQQVTYLLYGFVGVISIIGAFSIVNTITTNLILRVREFGILRAIGMTDQQLKRMILLEGFMYGLISSLVGSVLGGILSYFAYLFIQTNIHDTSWSLDWPSMLIASVTSMIIGVLSTLFPLRRIRSLNVVESIRTVD